MFGVLVYQSLSIPLRQSLPEPSQLGWKPASSTDLVTPLLRTGALDVHRMPNLVCDSENLNSSPQDYTENAFHS